MFRFYLIALIFLTPLFQLDKPLYWCGADYLMNLRTESRDRDCQQYGAPDDPVIRDSFIPQPGDQIKVIRLYIHGFANDDGSNPTSNETIVESQINYLNEVFFEYYLQFEYEFEIHNNSDYVFVNNQEFDSNQIQLNYNFDVEHYLNIFVVGGSGLDWIGISDVPWNYWNIAFASTWTTFVDRNYFGYGEETLVHELGHALGLYHTFRGVDEVATCGNCYEYASGNDSDVRGDLCSDTRPTPMTFSCSNPTGLDCEDTPWGDTPVENFMGYSNEWCQEEFTLQQTGRMHGWIMERLESWLVELEFVIGDPSEDGLINVNDINLVISFIAGIIEPTMIQEFSSDMNEDFIINIQDVIMIVNIILGN